MNIRKAFLHKAVPAACVLFAAGTIFAADRADLMGYVPGAEVMKVDVTDGRIDTISGIIYSQIKSQRSIRQLRMTVMTPRTKARKPAVVYFPGGGFTSADHEKFIEMRHALARAGFVVAAAEYRTVPVKFPALVEDGKAAVRYLRAHADEYGIDPERIGVIGDSAGGYLVHGPAFGKSPGGSILSDREKAMNASSLGHIDGSEPPFLIMHGSGDRLVSPMQSAHLAQALRKAGTDVEYVLVEGAGHGDLPWFQKPVIERVVKFFEKRLGSPAKDAAEGNNL